MSEAPSFIMLGFALEAILIGFVMRRRGYDGYVWLLLGMFLGPIALFLAIAYVMRGSRQAVHIVRGSAHAGAGNLDVVVGYDGSAEATEAVERVRALLGDRLGRLAIAEVTPFDSPPPDENAAEAQLRDITNRHPELHATAVVLHGQPAVALQDFAEKAGYELIVVGTRGAGWSKLMGSVATALARQSRVPVLLVDNKPALRASA
ncbi:MAG TPA: universal stress protein [Acidimicrobiales bacterium]|nr:universal stress protein [Acidimicrobiales bacterium]